MAAGVKVVECIEDDIEGLEPGNIESYVFDIGVVGGDRKGGVEFQRSLASDLQEDARLNMIPEHGGAKELCVILLL